MPKEFIGGFRPPPPDASDEEYEQWTKAVAAAMWPKIQALKAKPAAPAADEQPEDEPPAP